MLDKLIYRFCGGLDSFFQSLADIITKATKKGKNKNGRSNRNH